MTQRVKPSLDNGYLETHAKLLVESFTTITGKLLLRAGEDIGYRLYHAPFVVVSHDTSEDPVFNYANKKALELFEMTWDQFTALPSRYSAEQPSREERQRLLKAVSRDGFIDNYTGIRVSSSGKRFYIEQATVWNLQSQGRLLGQAATFDHWTPLD